MTETTQTTVHTTAQIADVKPDVQTEDLTPLCGQCFPVLAVLKHLDSTPDGRAHPYIGNGSNETVISCAHGEWLLENLRALRAKVSLCAKPGCASLTTVSATTKRPLKHCAEHQGGGGV